MKNFIGISTIIVLIFFILRNKIDLEYLYRLAGIAGFSVATLTLYFNFLKPPIPKLLTGKNVILIWHDNMLNLAPMVDVFCTILNDGGQPLIIDGLEIELIKDKDKEIFTSYLFLKLVNGREFQLDQYSHPFIVNKYSTYSVMIGFRNRNLSFNFVEGKYRLKIKAISTNKSVAEDQIGFVLTNGDVIVINSNKSNKNNKALEVKIE